MYLDGQRVQEHGYLADLITGQACAFIDRQKADRPFFLTVSHFNPHVPYSGHPAKYYEMYAKTGFGTLGWEPESPRALREKDMLKDTVGTSGNARRRLPRWTTNSRRSSPNSSSAACGRTPSSSSPATTDSCWDATDRGARAWRRTPSTCTRK